MNNEIEEDENKSQAKEFKYYLRVIITTGIIAFAVFEVSNSISPINRCMGIYSEYPYVSKYLNDDKNAFDYCTKELKLKW